MSSKAEYLKKYLSGGKTKKRKSKKKRVRQAGAVKLIDEDDDWRTYAPTAVANMDFHTAEQGENAPVVVAAADASTGDAAGGKGSGAAAAGAWASDSDSSTGHSRGRKRQRRSSPSPRRRSRHDSDSDGSPPRRARHDSSDDDASPPRRARHDSDASPPRRARHDSDASPPRRARHDSDASPPRRARHDSDASPPRRARNASDSDASPPRRAPASDSDASPPRRGRQDSDSDASPPRRGDESREKMLSGASAGLQHAGEFKHEQERLRRKNEAQFAHADAEMQGRNAKTVYRDKHGRRVDKDAEVAKQKAIADGLEAKQKAEEYLWNTGAVQKKKRQAEAQHLAHEAAKPLARYKDDTDLDQMLRKRVRADDPMAAMLGGAGGAGAGGGASGGGSSVIRPRRRMCPNRFGIPAGYRWDGEDRGNGFEKRLLLKRSSDKANSEAKYMWSVADM